MKIILDLTHKFEKASKTFKAEFIKIYTLLTSKEDFYNSMFILIV